MKNDMAKFSVWAMVILGLILIYWGSYRMAYNEEHAGFTILMIFGGCALLIASVFLKVLVQIRDK